MLRHGTAFQPMTQSVVFAINMTQHGPGSVNEQLAQVAVAALADTQQAIPSTSAVLSGVNPREASKFRPLRKAFTSPRAPARALAVSGPTPCNVIKRFATGSCLTPSVIRSSNTVMRTSRCLRSSANALNRMRKPSLSPFSAFSSHPGKARRSCWMPTAPQLLPATVIVSDSHST